MKSRREPNHERVFGILAKASAPMSAYEVLDAARRHMITAPPTVYRALNRLISEGRAHRLETINAYIACAHDHHGHGSAIFAICSNCGQVKEISEPAAIKRLTAEAGANGFQVEHAVIELKGRCADCAQEGPPVEQSRG
jgi:Fur family zinc uptake transcriptional regulator